MERLVALVFRWAVIAAVAASCDARPAQAPDKASKTPPSKPASRDGSDRSDSRAEPTEAPQAHFATPKVSLGASARFEAVPRLVAIGDVHGDLAATRVALRLAGAIDEDDAWVGGPLVIVQTGDQLDRGDDEQAILDLLDRLSDEARKAGGALHVLNGNHEVMNVIGDLRYVTAGGFEDFEDVEGLSLDNPALAEVPPHARARLVAFSPGGPYAKKLAERHTVIVVGDTVFAHGGVEPQWVGRIEEVNRQARALMLGTSKAPREAVAMLMAQDGVVWSRRFSLPDVSKSDCEALEESLRRLGVERMVVGHTVQKQGITSACEEQVWRIDVGMAEHYGGRPAVLEIADGKTRVLTAPG